MNTVLIPITTVFLSPVQLLITSIHDGFAQYRPFEDVAGSPCTISPFVCVSDRRRCDLNFLRYRGLAVGVFKEGGCVCWIKMMNE